MKLKVIANTFFKHSTHQTAELNDGQKVAIEKGKEFDLHSHAPAAHNHVKIALLNLRLGSGQRNTWYVYEPHITIQDQDREENTDQQPPTKPQSAKAGVFNLPGFQSSFYLSEPIIAGGHLKWYEATKNGSRMPQNRNIVNNIVKVASLMEEIRRKFGNRVITVTSWYRPPAVNKSVSGAKNSTHLSGSGIDFRIEGVHPWEVYKSVDRWHRGGLGKARSFTHLDISYNRRWLYSNK